MGLVGDISALLIQVYKLWQEHRGQFLVTPQTLYDKYVGPSYRLLKELHADYEDIYLELSERVQRDSAITDETLAWFARARSRRAADRSELAVLTLPDVHGSGERIMDLNTEALAYLAAVRDYFRPAPAVQSAGRVRGMCGSASTQTEVRLRLLHHFLRVSPVDRRAIVAESASEGTLRLIAYDSDNSEPLWQTIGNYVSRRELNGDDVIYGVLEAVSDHLPAEITTTVKSMEMQAEQAAAMPLVGDTAQRRLSPSSVYDLSSFRWQSILSAHIEAQREHLAKSIKRIQLHHVRLRVLADR